MSESFWLKFCTAFGLPALIIVIAALLLATGIDGEVKTILALAAGWIFKSGYSQVGSIKSKTDAPQSKSDS